MVVTSEISGDSNDGGDPKKNPSDENQKLQEQETSTMGAPKQIWTQEEESALNSGVIKHGTGRWRTILKDPEFSGVLYLRSSVDLEDKWRNMSVMGTGGWGSRENSRLAKPEEHSPAIKQVSTASATRRPARLDNLIMEAIVTLKEPGGSNKTTIGAYIEEQYEAPPDFRLVLSTKLKYMAACGKLMEVEGKYIIPNSTPSSSHRIRSLGSGLSLPSLQTDRDEVNIQSSSPIEAMLDKMKTMDVHEAAAYAAQAVAEAETVMAEADEAAEEAEAADVEAEAAQAFIEDLIGQKIRARSR